MINYPIEKLKTTFLDALREITQDNTSGQEIGLDRR
jgi:hypothetical protein